MKSQLKWLGLAVAMGAFVFVQTASAAPQTWTGKISDKMCGASHKSMAGGKSDTECTTACVKGGAEYVFVGPGDKVFAIANQKFADLPKHAGHTVQLTGELGKDGAITVTKIAMPPGK
jgi:hypothetical protein